MIRFTGAIRFDGIELNTRSTEKLVRLGIAHVPQGRGTFTRMTVEENLRLGAISRNDDITGNIDRMYAHFPKLKERRSQQGGKLSRGGQQKLPRGRALTL